jgi:hypothetical protein
VLEVTNVSEVHAASIFRVKVKVKLSLSLTKHYAIKTCWNVGGITLCILNLDTTWK